MQVQPTVFVVDDDDAVRDALVRLIRSIGLQAEPYQNAGDFLEAYDQARPGCVILDIRMPQMSGLKLQDVLRERGAELPIIFLTAHGDVQTVVQAMKGGAVEFLEKPVSEQLLLDCVQRSIREDAARRDQRQACSEFDVQLESLTERERQVMELLVAGENTKEVAASLDLSPKTIEYYRVRILDKLEVDSVVQLVRKVMSARTAGTQLPHSAQE